MSSTASAGSDLRHFPAVDGERPDHEDIQDDDQDRLDRVVRDEQEVGEALSAARVIPTTRPQVRPENTAHPANATSTAPIR
jgi:hypothetical protein